MHFGSAVGCGCWWINLIDRKELNIEKEVQRTAFYTDGTFHCSWRCTSDDVIKQEFESQVLKETVQLQLSRALLAYLSTAAVAFISCLGLHFSGLSIRDVTELKRSHARLSAIFWQAVVITFCSVSGFSGLGSLEV